MPRPSVPSASLPVDSSRREFCRLAAGVLAACAWVPRLSADEDAPGIIGHGDFKYRLDAAWGSQDRTKIPVNDCHEMVQVSDGRLFMLTNEARNNILVYDKGGKVLETWGNRWPGAHGLTLSVEGTESFLFITDVGRHEVVKTDLKGNVLLRLGVPVETGKYPAGVVFRPTEVAVAPNGDFYVVDGYGAQYVIHYDAKGGIKGFFGGEGWRDGLFMNAHGVAWDARDPKRPLLCVTERHRNGFQWFDPTTYAHVRTVRYPGAFTSRPVIVGKHLYSACLISHLPFHSRSGFVLITDDQGVPVSAPGANEPKRAPAPAAGDPGEMWAPLRQTDKRFIHPHDVCVDDEQNLYIPQWNSGKTYPYKMTRVR